MFLSKIKIYVIGIFAVIFAFAGIYIKGQNDGKISEKNKQLKGKINAVKKSNKARMSLRNNDTVNKLHKKYQR
jgi:hypothetical protein